MKSPISASINLSSKDDRNEPGRRLRMAPSRERSTFGDPTPDSICVVSYVKIAPREEYDMEDLVDIVFIARAQSDDLLSVIIMLNATVVRKPPGSKSTLSINHMMTATKIQFLD